MNTYDKNNLNYLLSLDSVGLERFCRNASEDDRVYALELLIAYRAELEVEKLEKMDNVESLSEAKKILDKFTLRG